MSDEIFALLQSIKQKLDLEIAREALDDIASILQDQHHIRLLSQLKLVEEKSWKNV